MIYLQNRQKDDLQKKLSAGKFFTEDQKGAGRKVCPFSVRPGRTFYRQMYPGPESPQDKNETFKNHRVF